MKNNTPNNIAFYLTLSVLLLVPFFSYAQQIQSETNVSFLRQNAVSLQKKFDENRNTAFTIAKQKGWPTLRVTSRGAIIALQGVDELGLPIYYITDNNTTAAATTSTSKLYLGGGLNLSLSGSTIANDKVAIWDAGKVLASHREFATGRILLKDNASTLSSHATHVAGTMIAQGLYSVAKGMAFGLKQLMAFDFNNDVSEMSANAASLLISNHSYGSLSGWQYNTDVSPARWEFWGNVGATEDYKFGYYSATARDWDQICYNAPYYLPVKSAGNNRNENGPAVGEAFYRLNSSGSMVNAGLRPEGISSNNGYGIIPTYGNAKNILTVGAINPFPFGPTSTSSIQISSFSSVGPTDDGRIKPDLVGDGVNVTSTTSTNDNAYTSLSGTSMASPNVSGTLVLLQELYSQKNAGSFMRSATLKALVLGTTSEAGIQPGPDYIFGWGLLNAEQAAKAILNRNTKSIINERNLSQGETQTISFIASGDGPIRATICWTDPEAIPIPVASALNNSSLRLVNDLDMAIKDDQNNNYLPWILDPLNPSAPAKTGDNFRDNVEQILIENTIPGKSYSLSIKHKGTLSKGPQAFSLVVTGVGGTSYCSSNPLSDADSKIVNFNLSNLNYSPNLNCTSYSDFTSKTINLEKGSSYPFSIDVGTCGKHASKIAKVFLDWNGDGDFSDLNELVATSGVFSGDGTFTGQVSVPENVAVNTSSRLRIVLTETSQATDVTACGTYGKGETQDYNVAFINPAIDAGIKTVNSLTASCATADQRITVTLKNYGTQTLDNIPVQVKILENSTEIATLLGTYQGSLSYLAEVDFTLPTGFKAEAGKTYIVSASTSLNNDLNGSNNAANGSISVSLPPTSVNATAIYCTDMKSYKLEATSSTNATIFWYKNNSDIQPISFGGSTATIDKPDDDKTFFVGLNDFSTSIGPKTKNDLGAGGYNQFTPGVSINTLAPITLESARLYIGNSGQIRFTAVNSSGMAVSTVLLDVKATKTIPAAGSTANDPLDVGQVYPLGLILPDAGNYTIEIEYLNGATIFRNNNASSLTSYPYQSALKLFNITGNTASESNSPDYYKGFYYYFYDLKVKSTGCPSTNRLAVKLTEPSISRTDHLLSSPTASGYQWYLNNEIIPGATAQTLKPLKNGSYVVEMQQVNGCAVRSTAYVVDDIRPGEENGINLKIYPVPTKDLLNLSFEVAKNSNVEIQVHNLLGQIIYQEKTANFYGFYAQKINLLSNPEGIYIITVKIGTTTLSRKIMLVR